MPRKTSQARSAYHHGNLRNELLALALRRFVERGSMDFTLRELARDLGVTHNAPYRHFAAKSELVAALREDGFARLAERERDAVVDRADDPRAQVRALGEAYVRFALEEPALFRLLLTEPGGEPAGKTKSGGESYAMLEQAIGRGRERGLIRDDLSARELALVAWSLVHGLSTLLSSGRLPVSEARVRRYSELCSAIFFEGADARA